MPRRYVRLLHLLDGQVREVADDGCDVNGRPTQTRQHLTHMLRRRIPMLDARGERVIADDGNPLMVPVFRLAEPPPPVPYRQTDEKEKVCQAKDQFDRDHLMDEMGRWRTPSKEWLAESKRRQAARRARAAEFEEMAKKKVSNEASQVVASLFELARKDTGREPEAGADA